MIKSLIFDFGKVLVDYDFHRFIASFIPNLERKEQFIDCILTDYWFKTLDKEDRPFEETIRIMQEQYPEFTEEIQIFGDKFPSIVDREVPGMYDLLSKLKAEGFKLYGLTNWCNRVHVTMAQYPIFNLLDGQVISSEVHEIKPYPDIYRTLLKKFNLNPSECVFTDDKEENILGSQAVGIKAIRFENAGQYERELRKIISEEKDLLTYGMHPDVVAFSTSRDAILPFPVLQSHQKHTTNVAVITDPATTREDLEGIDAMVTNLRDFAIGVRTADCIPILLYDPVNKAIAAIHAGWRGTVARISAKVIDTMTKVYGTRPGDLIAQIGPGIGFDSFQVGEELIDQFKDAGFPMDRISRYETVKTDFPMSGGWHIDLWEANRLTLIDAGIYPDNIRIAGICTYKNEKYYSARRETIACGRIINVIKLI